MRKIFVIVIATVLVGCGAQQQRVAGIEEDTTLIIRGETLIGLTVSVTPGFSRVIGEGDLTEFTMGIGGVNDSENQNLETITLKVESGLQRLTVTKNGSIILDKELHFTHGQTREMRIR